MAFNLLWQLSANPVDEEDKDVCSPVDDVGDEIDGESNVDFDVEDRGHNKQDLSLNSADHDDSEIDVIPVMSLVPKPEFAWTDQLLNV